MSVFKKVMSIMMLGTLVLSAAAGCNVKKDEFVTSLTVDYVENPVGIDNSTPLFGWNISDPDTRGQKQTAYRIGVSTSEKKLENDEFDVWDSGKTESDVSVAVPYGGTTLTPSTRYFWKVTVFDKDNAPHVSETACFETGLMDKGFEGAQFITQNLEKNTLIDPTLNDANWIWRLNGARFDAAPEGTEYFRKKFEVPSDKEVAFALIIFSADDYGKVYVNGKRVYTIPNVYDRWRTGNAVDITSQVKNGNNVLAAEITNASTGYGGFICKLQVKYTDGSVEVYNTDKSWRCTKEAAEGFETVEFDDSSWVNPDQCEGYGQNPWGTGVIMPTTIDGADKTAAPILRKTFNSEKKVKSARLYATAAGLYYAELNGEKVGDDFLTPGFTEYPKHLMYQTFDVTEQLKKGENTLSVTLGNGWYIGTIGAAFGGRYPAFLSKLVIKYTDGTTETIVTDGSWEVTLDGPITANDIFNGETYDATRNEKEFSYDPVSVVNAETLKMGEIISQITGTNIRQMDELKPVNVTAPTKKSVVYDFGQNMTGVVEITVKAEKGTEVTIRHGEMLNDGNNGSDGVKGTLYTTNLRSAEATDRYICGGKKETWSPVFTFHGFRYIEITGIEQEDIVSVKAKVLYSALADSATFECSEPLINRLALNAYWGQRSNFVSVPTDCPQRDERMGWSGDAQIFVGTAAYNMEVKQFYEKYLMDLNDGQRDNGAYPDCAPATNRPSYNGAGHGGWADAGIIIPYTIALRYGDQSHIVKYYGNMVKYIEYLVADAGDYIRNTQFVYGDWLSLGENTPIDLCDTAYCAYVCDLMSEMAGWLNKTEDAAKFKDYANKFKAAWNKQYLNADGKTKCDTQTSYVLGLWFDIIPEDRREASASRLNEKIIANGNKLTTGFMGCSYLLPVLCEYGYVDTAFALLEQKECPSWLYPVLQGATTIWERWDSYTIEGGFGAAGMNSFNHYSYGSVMEWVYSSMIGIACDENSPAFKHFILKPTYGGSLSYAKGSYKSAYGVIESGWEIKDNELIYTCLVPANTTATLLLPCEENAVITESGERVTPVRYENGRAVFELESGKYEFKIALK